MGNRRDFIQQSSLAAFGLTGLSQIDLNFRQDQEFVNVRNSLGLKKGLTYMNTGSLGPLPLWVSQKEFDLSRELELNPASNNWGTMGKRMEEVRSKAALFLNCNSSEVVLTRNTTEGLSMVSSTLYLKPGDEILTTNHEHGGGENGLNYAAKFAGAKIVKVELPLAVDSKEQVIAKILDAITSRTKVLLLSHVTTIEGMQMPLEEISNSIKGKGIFFMADGAQSAGMLQIDVKKLGVDVFASSGHKWMLGPKETGLLYIKEGCQDKINAVFTFSGFQSYSASSGTRNVAHQIAFGELMDWHLRNGQGKIQTSALKLGQYCYEKLKPIRNIRLISPQDQSLRSALISFEIRTGTNKEVYDYLKTKDIIVKVLPKYNAIRLSNHIFNTKSDVDKTVNEIDKYLNH